MRRMAIPTLKIAIAQIAPTLGDLKRNLALHQEAADRARAQGDALVLFPELSLTGYHLMDLVYDLGLDPARAGELRALKQRSREIGILLGFVERSRDQRFYNAAAYLAGGKLRHRHRKVYLPTYQMFDEARYFAPGDRFAPFALGPFRAGILICEDAWHLSAGLIYALQGTDLLVLLANSPFQGGHRERKTSKLDVWRGFAQTLARYLTTYTCFVNRAGVEDGTTYTGGSCVFGPDGESLVQAKELEPDLVRVTLEVQRVRDARIHTPLLRDEKLHLLRETLDQLAAAEATVHTRAGND